MNIEGMYGSFLRHLAKRSQELKLLLVGSNFEKWLQAELYLFLQNRFLPTSEYARAEVFGRDVIICRRLGNASRKGVLTHVIELKLVRGNYRSDLVSGQVRALERQLGPRPRDGRLLVKQELELSGRGAPIHGILFVGFHGGSGSSDKETRFRRRVREALEPEFRYFDASRVKFRALITPGLFRLRGERHYVSLHSSLLRLRTRQRFLIGNARRLRPPQPKAH